MDVCKYIGICLYRGVLVVEVASEFSGEQTCSRSVVLLFRKSVVVVYTYASGDIEPVCDVILQGAAHDETVLGVVEHVAVDDPERVLCLQVH